MIHLLEPPNAATVSLQSKEQITYIVKCNDCIASDVDWRNVTQTTDTDCTFPAPVIFTWQAEDAAQLQISSSKNFDTLIRSITAYGREEVYNLKIGFTYYWRVICGNEVSDVYSFSTEDRVPRWIYINGTTNVRDIGGWKTVDGKHIRQGMLYRGSSMGVAGTFNMDSIIELRDFLGVRTDLDLRGEVVGQLHQSPLGGDVTLHLVPISSYSEMFKDTTPLPVIFCLLADCANYPIYFHCVAGADRTASLAAMIEALCGVSDADMDLDYELTSLSIWGERSRMGEGWQSFMNELKMYGKTRHEQVRAFLRHAGVTDETMDRIVEILVE